MNARHLFVFISALFHSSNALNIIVYSPLNVHSHASFVGKVADQLAEDGHKVVLLQPIFNPHISNKTTKHCDVIQIPFENELTEVLKEMIQSAGSNRWTASTLNPINLLQSATRMKQMATVMCKAMIRDQELIERLKAFNFDIGFSQAFETCGYGIFHLIGLKKYNTIQSLGVGAAFTQWLGAPNPISYVPGTGANCLDKMSLSDRILAVAHYFVEISLFDLFVDTSQNAFDETYNQFPRMRDLVLNSTFFIVNAEPLIDFPKPTIGRIVNIGGIATEDNIGAQLPQDWEGILSQRTQSVLISFGSISKSTDMPEEYKMSILDTFARFPNVTFIWKYEDPTDVSLLQKASSNVVLSKWVPQSVLLNDPRLSAFITHGGAGSITELSVAGKKAIVIPLFADQFRNARMMERAGSAIVMNKFELSNSHKLTEYVQRLLTDNDLTTNATRISEMLRHRPFSSRETLLRYTVFSAQYGPFPQLEHYSQHLSVIQYYLIDVIVVSSIVVVTVFILLIMLIKRCFCKSNVVLKRKCE